MAHAAAERVEHRFGAETLSQRMGGHPAMTPCNDDAYVAFVPSCRHRRGLAAFTKAALSPLTPANETTVAGMVHHHGFC